MKPERTPEQKKQDAQDVADAGQHLRDHLITEKEFEARIKQIGQR